MFREQEIQHLRAEKVKLEESLRAQERSSSSSVTFLSCTPLTRPLDSKVADLEKTIRKLCKGLADSQRAAAQKVETLDETIKTLIAKDESSSASIVILILVGLTYMSNR